MSKIAYKNGNILKIKYIVNLHTIYKITTNF